MRENLVWCPCLFFYLNFRGEVIPQLRRKQLGTLCTWHASDVFAVTQPAVHTHLSIWSRQPSRKEWESRERYWRCRNLRNSEVNWTTCCCYSCTLGSLGTWSQRRYKPGSVPNNPVIQRQVLPGKVFFKFLFLFSLRTLCRWQIFPAIFQGS